MNTPSTVSIVKIFSTAFAAVICALFGLPLYVTVVVFGISIYLFTALYMTRIQKVDVSLAGGMKKVLKIEIGPLIAFFVLVWILLYNFFLEHGMVKPLKQ